MRDKKEAACCGKCADQALNMSGGKGSQRRRRRCCCPPESVAADWRRRSRASSQSPTSHKAYRARSSASLAVRIPSAQGEQHIFLYGTGKDGWILKYHTHAPAQFRQRWRTVFSLSRIDRQGSGAEIQAYLPPRVSQPGNSSFNRLNARRKVVFPDPDRPRIAVSPCAGKVPKRSRMTTYPPKAMERLPMRARWGMRDPYFCSQASRRCWRSSGA